jgi:O-antigen/teichoic acid export membrane protein
VNLKVQAIKNVGSSWFGLGMNVLVGLFLSPFILHRLGDDAFGLWVLIFSITGYYGLFDFGIRSSIIRYVSKYTATKDYERLNQVLNTSLFSYSCLAVVLLLITGVGTRYVDQLFRISPNLQHTAQILFLIVGIALALGFPLSLFGGILEGLQQFYPINLIQVISTLARALFIVIALHQQAGLITIAAITVALPLLASASYLVIVLRMLPLQFGRRFIRKAAFRDVVNYGSVTFLILLAARLRFRTDAMVIGTFLSAAAITYFTVGSRFVDYANDIVQALAQIFTPMSSHFHSKGDFDKLRKIFIEGNRACALTMFPISVALILLGKSAISVWVGPKYVSSYIVLLILVIPSTLYSAQATSTKILFGMSKHRSLGVVVVLEGVANLILSIYLVRRMGIVGDALGTAIPLLCTSVFFLPRHLCRLLNVPVVTFLRQAYLLPLALCVPLVMALWLMQHWFFARTYPQLIFQLGVGGIVYAAGLLWVFVTREPDGIRLRARFMERMQGAAGR